MSGVAAGPPTRVLITGASGAGTIAVIESLRALGGYELVAADAVAQSAGLSIADRGYVIPFGAAPDFERSFRELLRRERPHFVIPTVDEEIPIVHRVVAAEFPDVRVVAPRPSFCAAMLDKWEMFRRLAPAGISVARSWLASDAAEAVYPAVVKPRAGRGSRGLAYLEHARDLATYLAAAQGAPEQYVVQERALGTEYTNSVVVGLDDELLCVVPKEVGVKRGITQVGITRRSAAIDAVCRAVHAALAPGGPFNVQLVVRADGTPVIFEINPRYSTTVALTIAAGVNEVDEVIRRAEGRPARSLEFEADLVMIRYPTQLYVREREWAPRDLR